MGKPIPAEQRVPPGWVKAALRANPKVTQERVAEGMGVTQATISKWSLDYPIDWTKWRRLLVVLGLSDDWRPGESEREGHAETPTGGTPLPRAPHPSRDTTPAPVVQTVRFVRLVREVDAEDLHDAVHGSALLIGVYDLAAAAGGFGRNVQGPRAQRFIEVAGLRLLERVKFFATRVVGHSMEPDLLDGDLCIFRTGDGLPSGEIVLARYVGPADTETGGSFTVKRLVVDEGLQGRRVSLAPTNKDYRSIVIDQVDAEHFEVAGRLVAVVVKQG